MNTREKPSSHNGESRESRPLRGMRSALVVLAGAMSIWVGIHFGVVLGGIERAGVLNEVATRSAAATTASADYLATQEALWPDGTPTPPPPATPFRIEDNHDGFVKPLPTATPGSVLPIIETVPDSAASNY